MNTSVMLGCAVSVSSTIWWLPKVRVDAVQPVFDTSHFGVSSFHAYLRDRPSSSGPIRCPPAVKWRPVQTAPLLWMF